MQWIILSILSIFNHLTPKYYLFGSFQSTSKGQASKEHRLAILELLPFTSEIKNR